MSRTLAAVAVLALAAVLGVAGLTATAADSGCA